LESRLLPEEFWSPGFNLLQCSETATASSAVCFILFTHLCDNASHENQNQNSGL